MAPERLTAKEEQRNAEDVVVGGLRLAALEVPGTRTREIFEIGRPAVAHLLDQSCNVLGAVDLETPVEEARVHLLAELPEEALLHPVESGDQRRRRIVDFQRPLDREAAAPVRPAACVEVRIAGLVLGIDAALALALEAQHEWNPAHRDRVALWQIESRILCQEGIWTLEIKV